MRRRKNATLSRTSPKGGKEDVYVQMEEHTHLNVVMVL